VLSLDRRSLFIPKSLRFTTQGNPAEFEAIGNRLGFRVFDDSHQCLVLTWQGPRFPAFLCLGIAFVLLFISIPIMEALRLRGFIGPAGSLWYFPVMNLILFCIALFLLSQKRTIIFDNASAQASLRRRSLHRLVELRLPYAEIAALRLGLDEVYSGFALGGSSAAEKFPVPSLRLIVRRGDAVLLDRGGTRRLKSLAERISQTIGKPLEIDERLRSLEK
jgi:hypothetical protein